MQALDIAVPVVGQVAFDELIDFQPVDILAGIGQTRLAVIGEGIGVFFPGICVGPVPFGNVAGVTGGGLWMVRSVISQRHRELLIRLGGQPAPEVVRQFFGKQLVVSAISTSCQIAQFVITVVHTGLRPIVQTRTLGQQTSPGIVGEPPNQHILFRIAILPVGLGTQKHIAAKIIAIADPVDTARLIPDNCLDNPTFLIVIECPLHIFVYGGIVLNPDFLIGAQTRSGNIPRRHNIRNFGKFQLRRNQGRIVETLRFQLRRW